MMLESGGAFPSDDAWRLAFIDMLPPEFSAHATMRMDTTDYDTFATVKKWSLKYVKVLQNQKRKVGAHTHLVYRESPTGSSASKGGGDEFEAENSWDLQEEELRHTMRENGTDADTQWVGLAITRGRYQQKNFCGRLGQRTPTGGPRRDARPGPPPRGVADLSYTN